MPDLEQLTPLFAVLGGIWVIWQFLLKREADPGAELEIQLEFVGHQGESWLIEVVAILRNQGLVRHWYKDFRLVVRYLLHDDPISDGEAKINYQLCCTRTIDDRISGARRVFANASYIDPRLTFRHSYVTFVPVDATFVWVQCSLRFPGRLQWHDLRKVPETKNVQRIFRVPPLERSPDCIAHCTETSTAAARPSGVTVLHPEPDRSLPSEAPPRGE